MTVEPTGHQPKGGQQPVITLASWGTRFVAWLIDFIIINAALGVLFAIVAMPFWFTGFFMNPSTMMMANNGGQWWNSAYGLPNFVMNDLVFFAYWIYMESKYNGQSIGTMLMHIRTTNLQGKQADVKSIVISSFGKAFLLPLDVFLGWIFTNDKRQRLLSRAANTIVIKE
jgi:uncharacterized RDD family membrane protein YckC